jgi:hypothetical protein
VSKLNATGTGLVYSTYLGGNAEDDGNAIAVDSSGNACVTGVTLGTFPTTGDAFQPTVGGHVNAFVTQINAIGTALVYSTYLSGLGGAYGYGIAVDGSGSMYVTGEAGFSFPTTSGAFQTNDGSDGGNGFVAKFTFTPSWNEFNGNAQHTGISTVAAQPTDQILWQTSLDQQGTYFWHTGEPVFTPNDTVIVPIILATGDTFELKAFNGATGALLWTAASSYIQPGYSWLPPYQPVYDPVTNNVYFAGPGGTLYYINNPDNPGSSTPTPSEVAFYGTSNYTANESAYNSSILIDTPLTVDNSGNVFFGFEETGSNPSGIGDGGIGRVSATGAGTYVTTGVAVGAGSGGPALGSAPAVSNDGSTVYVAINDSNGPYLVGVNATTLAPQYSVELSVPNSSTGVYLINQGTAAPMVAPDGEQLRRLARLHDPLLRQPRNRIHPRRFRVGRYRVDHPHLHGSLLHRLLPVSHSDQVQQLRGRRDGLLRRQRR